MESLQLSDDILLEINNFIKHGDKSKQLEITISKTEMTVKDYLNETSFIDKAYNSNESCSICQEKILVKNSIRIIKKCNHIYHKKCFDNLFKQTIIHDNEVNEISKICPNCDS